MFNSNQNALARIGFVGRGAVIGRLNRILQESPSRVVLLEGEAGIGKTTILDEAARLAEGQSYITPHIVDFYDTEVHSSQGLQDALASAITSNQDVAFEQYWNQRLATPQAELWQEFETGYRKATNGRPILLRFDTVERLTYERDSEAVTKDCQVDELDAPGWRWLLNRASTLPNTTVLLASRPTDFLRKRLLREHGNRLEHIRIKGLNLSDTFEYFRATQIGQQTVDESPDLVRKVHLLSDGRPILIALTLDWIKRGMLGSGLSSMSLDELRELKRSTRRSHSKHAYLSDAQMQWEELRKQFEAALIRKIRDLEEPLDIAVSYAAVCRKGCDANLLSRLMNVDQITAEKYSNDLKDLSFVKPPRPGSRGMFFLHDQMYDLVETHVLKREWPGHTKQAQIDEQIIKWYTEQITQLEIELRDTDTFDLRERTKTRRSHQLLITERLYYQFDQDPISGYQVFSRYDEEAISSVELEWDTWLRNEALWFTSNRAWRRSDSGEEESNPTHFEDGRYQRTAQVDNDCRRRWINRYIARGEYDIAINIANTLLARLGGSDDHSLGENTNWTYEAGLHVALATAFALKGGSGADESMKEADIAMKLIRQFRDTSKGSWLSFHLLGVAYLARGLALRSQFRWLEAADDYEQAAEQFSRNKNKSRTAEANNNRAYVLARSGLLEQAWRSHEIAYSVRERAADEVPLGLSLNTAGLIHERQGNYEKALEMSREALRVFEKIENRRGIALTKLSLGRSLRRKGRAASKSKLSKPDGKLIEDIFQEAREYLLAACDFFENKHQVIDYVATHHSSTEVFYAVESYDELGCLYRDWVASLFDCGYRDLTRLTSYLHAAETALLHAQSLIGIKDERTNRPYREFHYVDVSEDLARVYYWWGHVDLTQQEDRWNQALLWLKRAESLTEEEEFSRHRERHFLLGKVHNQYARIYQAKAEWEMAARAYARSASHLEQYSPQLPELKKTIDLFGTWVEKLPSSVQQRCLATIKDVFWDEDLQSLELNNKMKELRLIEGERSGVQVTDGRKEVSNE